MHNPRLAETLVEDVAPELLVGCVHPIGRRRRRDRALTHIAQAQLRGQHLLEVAARGLRDKLGGRFDRHRLTVSVAPGRAKDSKGAAPLYYSLARNRAPGFQWEMPSKPGYDASARAAHRATPG